MPEIYLFEPLIFLLLVADVSADRVLVTTNRGDEKSSGPEMLPNEIAFALSIDWIALFAKAQPSAQHVVDGRAGRGAWITDNLGPVSRLDDLSRGLSLLAAFLADAPWRRAGRAPLQPPVAITHRQHHKCGN